MKRKALCSVICTVLVLLLAVTLLVACNDKGGDGGTYTITFQDGTNVVYKAEVKAGAALTAEDIPLGPDHAGQTFMGWYIGSLKVDVGYTPTASRTAVASYVNGTVGVKHSVTVRNTGDFTVNGLAAEGYEANAPVSFTIEVTDPDKIVGDVISDDVVINATGSSYTFTMPDKDVSIAVVLKSADDEATKYTVTVSNESADFTVTGLDRLGYAEGDEVVFHVEVNAAQMALDEVTSVSDIEIVDLGDGYFSFTMIDSNIYLIVLLKSTAPEDTLYQVSYAASSEYTIGGLAEDGYKAGATVTFTVAVNNSEKYLQSVDSEEVSIHGINGMARTYQFTMPAKAVTIVITLATKQAESNDIQLWMYGDLYTGGMRTLYAHLADKYKGQDLVWSSSDESVAYVSDSLTLQGNMPDTILVGQSVGTVTITCALAEDESVYAEYFVNVKGVSNGTALSAELYAQLQGSLKLKGTETWLNYSEDYYNSGYKPAVERVQELTLIWEDMGVDLSDDVWDIPDTTDAFQFEARDKESQKVTWARKYVTDGRYVCDEYLDWNNNIAKEAHNFGDEYEAYYAYWLNSTYTNIFTSYDDISAANWVSFDDGHTYHFIGSPSGVEMQTICVQLWQSDLLTDDLYFTVENGEITKITGIIDPMRSLADEIEGEEITMKYGNELVYTFSDKGTAKITHIEPYPHETFHDGIKTAIENMAELHNYKAVITYGNTQSTYIFTEDAIDITTKDNIYTTRSGIHKEGDNKYYEYTVKDGQVWMTKHHNTDWDKDGNGNPITRYPTFKFAAEIFGQKAGADGVYVSRNPDSGFFTYMGYISTAFTYNTDWTKPVEITLSGNYLGSASTTVRWYGDDLNISIVYSEFNTASIDLNYAEAKDEPDPTSWKDANSDLWEDMQAWNFPDIPYVQPHNTMDGYFAQHGWKSGVGWSRDYGEHFAYFSTVDFQTEQDRDQFVADYVAALKAEGYTPCAEKDPVKGYDMYQRGDVKIAIGVPHANLGDGYLMYVEIGVYSDQLAYPTDNSDW